MPNFPSTALDPSTVKASFREASVSEMVNSRWAGMPRGIYHGWEPATIPGSPLLTFNVDSYLGFSIMKVNSPLTGVMVDIFAASQVTLDFTGHTQFPVFVLARADYAKDQITQARIFTRSTGSVGATEIVLCVVDKPSANLVVGESIPSDRQPPLAFQGQPFGYMQAGASDDITFARSVTAEVIRARDDIKNAGPPPPSQRLADRLAIDLAADYLADQLGLRSVPVVGNARPIAGSATSGNFSGSFSALHREFLPALDIEPAGNETTEGAITSPADAVRNVCFLLDDLTGDRLQTADRWPIYGRCASSVPTPAGTAVFVQAATTVTGFGSDWLASLESGDLLLAPDGSRYEIDEITSNTTLELITAYLDTTTGAVPLSVLRFTVDFLTRATGVEAAAPLPGALSVRLIFPAWFRMDRSVFGAALFMKRVGELPATPEATDAIRGRIRMAVGGSEGGAIHTIAAGGSPVANGPNWHTLNFTGTNASVVAAPGSPGVANIIVPGEPGPAGPGSIEGDQGDDGGAGPGAGQNNPFERKTTPDGPGGFATHTVNFAAESPPVSGNLVHLVGGFGSYEFTQQFQHKSGFRITSIQIISATEGEIQADLDYDLTFPGGSSALTRLFLGASS
jgi:hypothetical protein